MKGILQALGVRNLWHFTDFSNIESITQKGGLYSLREIRRNGIDVAVFGGNEISHQADVKRGVDNFVHLAFVKDHPMLFRAKNEGRINNPKWLKIDVSVLDYPDVRYCNDVSNKNGVPILRNEQAKAKIDIEILFTKMNWKDPVVNARRQIALKSEILVPKFVPIEAILNL